MCGGTKGGPLNSPMSGAERPIRGERFAFGANWARFLELLDDRRIAAAESSLRDMLLIQELRGKSFLDIGSGSGLFSLAARRLGANVFSFDYDPDSVACTAELRRRFFPNDPRWVVQQGSVLDAQYVASLGRFDVVYSWGVLHHTGRMWEAIGLAAERVRPGGQIFIAIYHDQGWRSRYWLGVKRVYNRNKLGKLLIIALHLPYFIVLRWLARTLSRQPIERGMDIWRDMIDWLGGLPFEVAKPESLLKFFQERGFTVRNLKSSGGRLGCNEFVFQKDH